MSIKPSGVSLDCGHLRAIDRGIKAMGLLVACLPLIACVGTSAGAGTVRDVALSDSRLGLVVGMTSGRITFHNLEDSTSSEVWESEKDAAVAVRADGEAVAFGRSAISLAWRNKSGQWGRLVSVALPIQEKLVSLDFSTSGDMLIAGALNGELIIWTLDPSGAVGDPVRLHKFNGIPSGIAFSPKESILVGASSYGEVAVWRLPTLTPVCSFTEGGLTEVSVDGSGMLLAVTSAIEGTLSLRRLSTCEELSNVNFEVGVWGSFFDPRGDSLVLLGGLDGRRGERVVATNLTPGMGAEELEVVSIVGDFPRSPAGGFSPNGRWMSVALLSQGIGIYQSGGQSFTIDVDQIGGSPIWAVPLGKDTLAVVFIDGRVNVLSTDAVANAK